MRINFFVITAGHAMGGATAYHGFANGMVRRGHEVHLIHRVVDDTRLRSIEDMPWATFEPGIEHQFILRGERFELPDADFICPPFGRRTARNGAPFDFMQGYGGGLSPTQEEEDRSLLGPYPRVCVSQWVLEEAKRLGVPEDRMVKIPNGIDHAKYRAITPIDDRPLQVSMAYRIHPQKGPAMGLRILEEVKRRLPDVRVVVFSQVPPVHEIPASYEFLLDPPQDVIVEEIYNQSRVFLCPSKAEGFGLASVEAMACGAALVTTANGGANEYAVHDSTALVGNYGDVVGMARHVEDLLRDHELRARITSEAMEFVRRFNWDTSAELLERFLLRYGSNLHEFAPVPVR